MPWIRRHPILSALLFVYLSTGCGSSSCGCGEVPLEEDLPEAEKVYDGIIAQVSPAGFAFIESNFGDIVNQFLPGGLTFELPPAAACNASGCSGQAICRGSTPCIIDVTIKNVGLSTRAPNVLRLDAQLDVVSRSAIRVQVCQEVIFCINETCNLDVHIRDKPISADLVLGVDPIMKTLDFDVTNPSVSISDSDFTLGGPLLCDIADFLKGLLTGLINDLLVDQVASEIRTQIDDSTCMPCDYFTAGCENGITDPGGATCDTADNWCRDAGSGNCVRQPLGMVGTLDMGAQLGLGAAAPLDMFIAPGQAQDSTTDPYIAADGAGLDLRVISGSNAVLSPCVPPASTVPSVAPPPRIDFATEAAGLPYMVGVGVSDRFLDKFFYDFYRSGGLCLNIGTSLSDLLTTGLFSTFLPSLGGLTEGRNAPMIIALRPKDRPQVRIGKGTFTVDGSGNTIIDDPLLTISMPKTHMDFYALIEERFVRLFTLKMDIELPLGLEFSANNEIVPIMGELGSLVTNIEALNSEILAEDPAVLVDIIPSIIGLAEPLLGGAIGPIALPDIQGFKLVIQRMEGMIDQTGTPRAFEHLGILADLELAANPAPLKAETLVRLVAMNVPPAQLMVPQPDQSLPRPTAVVEVSAFDARKHSPGLEWQYRVDESFWSPFTSNRRLVVASPQLLLQGRHVIEVRARGVDDYRTVDPTPARVEVLVDWEAPKARLEVDHDEGVARVHASDLVSLPDRLTYAFAVDGGHFTGFSADPEYYLPLDVSEVVVKVRDEAGNEKSLRWSGTTYDIHGRPPVAGSGGCNCASAGASPVAWPVLLLGLVLVLRRRRS